MRLVAAILVLYFMVPMVGACASREGALPSELAPGVTGVVKYPPGGTVHPGVVLLHGSRGWRSDLVDLASILADAGFVTLAIDYYAEVDRAPPGSAEKLAAWPGYQAAARRSVEYLQSDPAVSGGPIGLVGFSRGAFLAVSVAASLPQVRAVVDFYGGGGGGPASLEEDVKGLPPVLILHGDADMVVPVSFARALNDAVTSAGGESELHIYQGAGHSFNAPSASGYSPRAADDAHRRMIEFLRRKLVPRPGPTGAG